MDNVKTDKARISRAKIGLAVAVFLGLFFCCQIAGAQISPKPTTSVIQGHVVDPDGAAIPEANIILLQEAADTEYRVTANCSGFYRQTNLPAGSYAVEISHPGYLTEIRNAVQVNSASFTEINAKLQTGDSADGPTLKRSHRIMLEGLETSGGPLLIGSIAGMVQDQTGAAIPGTQIMAIEVATGYSQKTTTDDSGLYKLPSLPWGTYGVRAESRGFSTNISKPVAVRSDNIYRIDIRLGLAVGRGMEVNAEPVPAKKLKHGSVAEPAFAGGIHGIVLDANGAVPARITVVEEATKKSYATSTDADGVYRFTNLPAGNYCTKIETAGPRLDGAWLKFETSREVRIEPSSNSELDISLPALR